MRPFNQWDFNKQRVQNDIKNGKYTSGKSTCIAFGPPEFRHITANAAARGDWGFPIPCGEIQNFGMSQQRQVMRLFEIGSERSIAIPGRSFGSLQLSRVLYDGPNLLKYFYLYYTNMAQNSDGSAGIDIELLRSIFGDSTMSVTDDFLTSEIKAPGKANFYSNLGSSLFNMPLGVMVYLKSAVGNPYGAVYFENCQVNSQQMSIDEGQPIIMESASLDFERAMPVDLATLSTSS